MTAGLAVFDPIENDPLQPGLAALDRLMARLPEDPDLALVQAALQRLRMVGIEQDHALAELIRQKRPLVLPGANADEVSLLRQSLDEDPDQIVLSTLDGKLIHANRAWRLGHGGGPLPVHEVLQEADLERRALTEGRAVSQSVERGGQHLTLTKVALTDPAGQPVAMLTRLADVTQTEALREELHFTSAVLEQSLDAILVTDPRLRIQTLNPAFQRLTDFRPASMLGRSLEAVLEPLFAQVSWTRMTSTLANEGHWQGELCLRKASGLEVTVWCSASRLADDRGRIMGHVLVLSDLTQIHQIRSENDRLARFDTLTQLPNRNLMSDRLEDLLRDSHAKGQRFAVVFLDLDAFKSVNDSLGHETGDEVLVAIARRLVTALGPRGFVARIGGDEFVILLPDCDEARAAGLAQDISVQLALPLNIMGLQGYRPSASIGVAIYPDHGLTATELLRSADTAMYDAKVSHGKVAFFRPPMRVAATHLLDLRNGLSGALERGEFVLHYQPIFRLADHAVVGAEALLRWNRPGHGILAPGAFLPIAESAGLMRAIDAWVLTRAMADLGAWRDAGHLSPGWLLSINQTADDLAQPQWANRLALAAESIGLGQRDSDPRLQIELTEGQVAGTLEALQLNLRALDRLGMRLAVDDFGTGYSNLSYLSRLPISMLKIDKSFVAGIATDANAEVLVRAVIGLGAQLGCEVLAEGIETVAQASKLAGMDCGLGQGFLLGPGVSAADFTRRWLKG